MDKEQREATESLERRVASLESAVRALNTELELLRTGEMVAVRSDQSPIAATPASSSTVQPPHTERRAAPARDASWLPSQIDFESLIGRYGTLLLATISALAAVGLFIGWAIEKGLLGPTQRIGLGLLTAAGLAVGGLRLRRRERSFGASLLGLALAITHVCAWGAGPSLQLVPPWGAFLLAAVASIALAIFAHAEGDEALWCVGFSGAAIAPFVTASGRANLLLLGAYGVAVLMAAGYAMGARRWMIAGRLFLLAALLYTAALATGFEIHRGPLLGMAFPLAVALVGVVPWIDGWRRRDRLRALGALATLAALRSGIGTNLPYDHTTVAALIAGAGLVWLILVDRTCAVAEPTTTPYARHYEGDWLDAAVLPLGFITAAAMALDASARGTGIGLTAAAAVLLITVVRFPQGSLRDAAVFASVISALVATLLLLRGRQLEITAMLAILSAACFGANVLWRSTSWTTLGLIGFAWATVASAVHLTERIAYEYTLFATKESGIAAIVLVSIAAARRFSMRDAKLEILLRVGAIAWAFIWVHQELAFAANPTVATLLRVTYYAATSVAAVGIGRARQVPLLRHLGLGLAVLAAGTALYGAKNLTAIGARIGADLVAAVFLLAIAYWYRRPGAGLTTSSQVSAPAGPHGSL